jgi:hypothetical protein
MSGHYIAGRQTGQSQGLAAGIAPRGAHSCLMAACKNRSGFERMENSFLLHRFRARR